MSKKKLFHVIDRGEWFADSDRREINELTPEEAGEIDWYRKLFADKPKEAAEKYLELRCMNGDGQVERMDVYVKDEAGNITRHTVVSEVTLTTKAVSSRTISENLENKNQISQTHSKAGI